MSRETQLDTHEIDKLLDDDDFIDDFDFGDDLDDQFAGAGDASAESLADDLAAPADDVDIDEFILEDDFAGNDTVAAEPGAAEPDEPVVELDLELGDLELGRDRKLKRGGRVLQIVVGLVVLFWLIQLAGVIYLVRRPIIVRDQIRPLSVETVVKPAASTSEPAVRAPVQSESYDEPDIYVFTSYVKLYSLDGLKVFSVEIEVVQYQKSGRLTDAEKVMLKESLRQALAGSVAGHMREEVVDLSAQLMAIIVPHIEKFFVERGVDPEKIKIRVHNPYIE